MTDDDEHHASDGTEQSPRSAKADPPPANEALPDGQFQDQQMPTTDGEPADPDPQPKTTDGAPAASRNSDGASKPDGVGQDGTIPGHPDGVAAGHTGVSSTFEPEEDELAE